MSQPTEETKLAFAKLFVKQVHNSRHIRDYKNIGLSLGFERMAPDFSHELTERYHREIKESLVGMTINSCRENKKFSRKADDLSPKEESKEERIARLKKMREDIDRLMQPIVEWTMKNTDIAMDLLTRNVILWAPGGMPDIRLGGEFRYATPEVLANYHKLGIVGTPTLASQVYSAAKELISKVAFPKVWSGRSQANLATVPADKEAGIYDATIH